ncbi:MAG: caspase family protein [Pseudorhodoplanes sp.]
MSVRSAALVFFLLLTIPCLIAPAAAQNRHALIVGIDAYRNVAQLSRAVADARAMSGALQSLGFKTRLVEDPDRNALSVALANFEESIEKGDTAFVFFAGHGIEIAGQNVLLPADVPDPARASAGVLRDAGFNTATLIERVTSRGARSAFFVFDACRDNPYAQSGNTRAVGSARGLARTEAPEGVFVLMSAGFNQQALDSLNEAGKPGSDRNPNSVFTRVLLDELSKPGLTHIVLAKAVQTRVRDLARSVNHAQVPAFYDQIIGDVVLRPDGPMAAPAQSAAVIKPQPAPPPVAAPAALPPPGLSFDIGNRWYVRETSASGLLFDGVWTRTGPRTLKAEWRERKSGQTVSDTIDIESERGSAVVLYRRGVNGRYFGALSPDGRMIWGHASWYGAGDRWAAEIKSGDGPSEPQPSTHIAEPKPLPPLDIGNRWIVTEGDQHRIGFEGVWTRTGPRTFKAEWRAVGSNGTASDTIRIESQQGNVVVLYREGTKGRYFGTISNDGKFLQGHASWTGPGYRWTAEIR